MENCASCGRRMNVEEVFGTSVVSEVPENGKPATKYAFVSNDSTGESSKTNLCPTCRREMRGDGRTRGTETGA